MNEIANKTHTVVFLRNMMGIILIRIRGIHTDGVP